MGYQLLQNYAEQVQNWGWICTIHSQNSRSFKRQVGFVSRKLSIEFMVHQEHRVWGSLSVRIPLKWWVAIFIYYICQCWNTFSSLHLQEFKYSAQEAICCHPSCSEASTLSLFLKGKKKCLLTSIQFILQAEIGVFLNRFSVLILYAYKNKFCAHNIENIGRRKCQLHHNLLLLDITILFIGHTGALYFGCQLNWCRSLRVLATGNIWVAFRVW